MKLLRMNALADLPQAMVPKYDPAAVTVGVVHIGATSNFGRSNILPYFDATLAHLQKQGLPLDYGVLAVKTTGGAAPLLRQLGEQDNLYTLVGRGRHQDEVRIIGSVREMMNYGEKPDVVIARIADPAVKIVTITGTQGAYCFGQDGRGIDLSHPTVVADVAHPRLPTTVPGILVAALAQRSAAGVSPPIIISCDNLPDNGDKLGCVLREFAEATGLCDPKYMGQVLTPNTMVDRITPQQDFGANMRTVVRHGVGDHAAVVAENYSCWKIEQRHSIDARLLPLQQAGVKLVKDLKPYEDMKIRGLNGAHLALGLVGTLAGIEFVHEAVENHSIRPFVTTLLQQAIATVKLPSAEKASFGDEVLARFDNTAMPDKLSRLLTETSSKVSARLVNYPAIKRGSGYEASAFAVAAWMRYMQGTDDNSNTMPIADTRSAEIGNVVRTVWFSPAEFLTKAGDKVFDVKALGQGGMDKAKPFFELVNRYYQDINKNGVVAALDAAFESQRHHAHRSPLAASDALTGGGACGLTL